MSKTNEENTDKEQLSPLLTHVTNMLLTRQNCLSWTKNANLTNAHERVALPLGDITNSAVQNVIGTRRGNDVKSLKPSRSRTRTIVIEGNIGSGKSTLLKYFSQKKSIEVFPEPVHKWRNIKGQNMLDLMYQDQPRWSFAFQSYVQFTMLQIHEAATSHSVKMMERSIHSCRYCFIENLYQSKNLQRPEYNVLCERFDWLLTTKDLDVDYIVYLRSTPEQCEKRIIERSRKEESRIPLDYLRDLHEMHEDWLIRRTKFELPAPVLVLDATKPLDDMIEQFTLLEEKLHLNNL